MTSIDFPDPSPWNPAAPTPQLPVRLTYTGSRSRLFWLALGRMMLTILTLGIGRFWMTTRLRQHYWSSIRIGGDPLEYTGTALEKLIGFMVAVVILAVYLAIANLLLTFAGFALFNGNPLAFQVQLLILVPLGFWAQYRARRYILARTRWRGIRFGLAPGAWGYMWRALGWWLLTIVTFGLLYPLMQLRLSRYATDRSFYGSLRFTQHGRLRPLMMTWLWVWVPIMLMVVAGGITAFLFADSFNLDALNDGDGGKRVNTPDDDIAPLGLVFGAVGGPAVLTFLYLGVIIAWVRHSVRSFCYLNSNRVLEGGTRFAFSLGSGSVIGIYVVGSIVMSMLIGLLVAVLAGVSFGVLAVTGIEPDVFQTLENGEMPSLSAMIGLAVFMLSYLPAIAAYAALSHAFITHPLIKEVVATTAIINLDAAALAQQRGHDEQAEAGGFADALGADIGGGF